MARYRLLAVVTTAFLFLVGGGALAHAQSSGSPPTVLVIRAEGPITQVIADQVSDAIRAAEKAHDEAVVIELDTPGGLATSTQAIVEDLLNANVPVVVYVTPPGARAASAGAIITFAANIAAMAPATHIGAATPIDLGGGGAPPRVVEDAVASVTSIVQRRGRTAEFAVDAVRRGRSATEDEALRLGAIDLVAQNRAELLDRIDGRVMTLGDRSTVRLDTAGAQVTEFEMPATRRLLQWLANPNLAFLFISLGGLALLIELATPGGGLAGTVGVILLVLGCVALSVLPTSTAGLILFVLAGAMFVAELQAPGIGVFAVGGALALGFAGLLVFQRPTGVGVGLAVLLPLTILIGLGAAFIGQLTWRTRKAPCRTGSVRGAIGVVKNANDHTGQVVVRGALWQARSMDGPLQVGERVRVVELEGMELIVYPES
jgi:membrane-bound serine protease (ClpP class)